MANTEKAIFVDEEVSHHVLNIINQAKKAVVFVTPYLDLWGHAQNAVLLAIKRHVDITFIVRADPEVIQSEDVGWLLANGVKVLATERLHAKIYLNEADILLSSMNLTESSTKSSLEIGVHVTDPRQAQLIREYVSSTLEKLAGPLPLVESQAAPPRTQASAKQAEKSLVGLCIRCGDAITFNPDRPLCEDCYESWAKYSNPDYTERFCHACGTPWDTSYEKPLCRNCYRELN